MKHNYLTRFGDADMFRLSELAVVI